MYSFLTLSFANPSITDDTFETKFQFTHFIVYKEHVFKCDVIFKLSAMIIISYVVSYLQLPGCI